MAQKPKILIFIVAYNAESHIESVLSRIPAEFKNGVLYDAQILIIDDASSDKTVAQGHQFRAQHSSVPLEIFKNPVNQGYGGNQKIGFHYAITHGFDLVVLLHGDGQYAPEILPQLVAPIVSGQADVVFGSRMLKKKDALKGRMPFYKFIGNIILTKVQNTLMGSKLSEFHSGYRVYSVRALRKIPFQYNSNGFDFDTDIIIQLLDNEMRIREIPIPTYYGNEISRVNGLAYAWKVVKSTLASRLQRRAFVYYNPKFDYVSDNSIYTSKVGFSSSHQFAIDQVAPGSTVLDIGCGPAVIARELQKKGCRVFGADIQILPETRQFYVQTQEVDLDSGKVECGNEIPDTILMLDIIEHLKAPEEFLLKLRESFAQKPPKLILTTANVAFIVIRLSLLLGHFNYGKKGILDMTHKRLSTFFSLKRLLINSGYRVEKIAGIPAPFPLVFGKGILSSILLFLNRVLIALVQGVFSYQIALVARSTPTLGVLLDNAIRTGDLEAEKI